MKTYFPLAILLIVSLFTEITWAVSPFDLEIMNDSSSKVYRTSDHSNDVFVIEAYFANCIYCNQNAPRIDALATEYRHEPRVQVLDIGIDTSRASYDTWIRNHQPNHPVLRDARGEKLIISQLGTTGYPSTYVLDCHLNVVAKTVGTMTLSSKNLLRTAIQNALDTHCLSNSP